MRADRLVSLVLLLRQRGRMTAQQLADELEVSTRTVLRDIEALSTAGVPVYADRGRHGGFSLLPGFRTELTGLTHDETVALLVAGLGPGGRAFGLAPELASALRKVADALPQSHREELDGAARRMLVEPAFDLLSRPRAREELAHGVIDEVRRAVLAGHRLTFTYARPGAEAAPRTVDPLGLVTVRDRTYLLATREGKDRTYRLSRMTRARALDEPAQRPADVDLEQVWSQRTARFLAEDHLPVVVSVRDSRREELLAHARSLRGADGVGEGWVRLVVDFEDLRHATWAIWQLGTDAVVTSPDELRSAVRERAVTLVDRYGTTPPVLGDGTLGS